MDPIVDSLRETINRDTTGIFGGQNVNKLSEKTMDLKDLYEAAIAEYDELEELTWDINYLLQFVRICAYRNIYLGLELMTMIRENAGGKTLTTEKEYTQVDVEVANMDIKASELSTNITADFATAFFETASQSLDYLDNDRIRKDLYKDPKKAAAYAAGTVAVAAVRGVINYFEDRSKKIEANIEIQKDMVKNVRVVVDGYSAGQGALLREIEIIKAIKKANDGFMAIYEPLRKKVFETNDISSVSKKDIQQMAIATSNYNKISTSKL
jgi:hypothetical protein